MCPAMSYQLTSHSLKREMRYGLGQRAKGKHADTDRFCSSKVTLVTTCCALLHRANQHYKKDICRTQGNECQRTQEIHNKMQGMRVIYSFT